jgi:hypothetical protein
MVVVREREEWGKEQQRERRRGLGFHLKGPGAGGDAPMTRKTWARAAVVRAVHAGAEGEFEEGDGADMRTRLVSDRGKESGNGLAGVGRPRKKRGRESAQAGGETCGLAQQTGPAGRKQGRGGKRPAGQNGEKGRERKVFLFFFQIMFFKSFSNRILNSFLVFVKTSHHKNKSTAALTQQHVSILIFDFKFAKVIISLSLNAHINAFNKSI